MNMYLVTGAAGFIGSHLVEKLLEKGEKVIGLDNFDPFYAKEIKEKNLSGISDHPGFEFIQGDIRNTDELQRIFSSSKIETIVHLAAKAGVRPSIKNPLEYTDVNVRGTMNLLEMSRHNNVKKFIFASTSAIYGANRKLPFQEDDNVDHPISPYAATKKACELLCYTYHHLFGIPIFCLRFFTVYGPRQRPDMAIHYFTKLIVNNMKIPVFGDGTSRRDYTYIDDIISGVMNAVDRCKGFEIYNLGESKTIELRELIRILEQAIGQKAAIEHHPNQPGDVPATYADISRARKYLEYNPSFDVSEGVSRFVDWYLRMTSSNV
ncbi:MAG: epimerase [Candidatus Schekmanbacteria bacterium RBG_13_48_7]|uniref:Epimerase n=1 Tax=Candidatus Schekmanbacteria bacterium RBG_13_48_7 TaxID=1817878 RepID=A0A1F7RPH9_9BACT|nr:MAG: epimerase [Candidatus Schekmanbacteria bacterium RBG_13_48_7]